MRSPNAAVGRIVDRGIFHSAAVQLFHSLLSLLAKVFNLSKFYRLGWASFRAGRLQSDFLAVVTECAFEGAPIVWITLYDSERTGRDAVPAAIANIRLNEYSAEFCAYDGTRWTRFQATCVLAMLANIGRKRP